MQCPTFAPVDDVPGFATVVLRALVVVAFVMTSSIGCSKRSAPAGGQVEGEVENSEAPAEIDARFCGPAFTPLPGACAYTPQSMIAPPTLVYYVHGMLGEEERPEHELELVKDAADLYGFAVLAPRGRQGLCTWSPEVAKSVCWPTKREAVDKDGQEILGSWTVAELRLGQSIGARFSRHYAIGFSNGGYFLGYVAPEGMIGLDGAAIVGAGRSDLDDKRLAKTAIPMFIAVGAEEVEFTREAAVKLERELSSHGWPVDSWVHEGRGHQLSEDDLDMAWVAWTR
jgi:predicted esterase